MRRLATLGLTVVLPAFAATACGGGFKQYECAPSISTADVDPHAVWRCHREIIQRIVRGRKFTLYEFRESSRFFESLTSISAESGRSHYGPLPGNDLVRRVAEWDAWYERNGSRLYWDPQNRQVRIRDQ